MGGVWGWGCRAAAGRRGRPRAAGRAGRQGNGCLIVFGDVTPDAMYTAAIQTIGNLDRVVDSLVAKSAKIVA